MVAALEIETSPADDNPVVIVGTGPVGLRVANEISRRRPRQRIVVFGAESELPYNRVRLTSLLAGDVRWESWNADAALSPGANVDLRLGCPIAAVDRAMHLVRDALGRTQPYSTLVLATGSRPRIPHIENIQLAGVYTFRDLRDAQLLFARRMRSRRTVVLGAGLLGLEAARAMQRFNTQITVIEHATRPMPRQLDDGAGRILADHMKLLGIELIVGTAVKRIHGDLRVEAVELADGRRLECDTIVVAAGIEPNVDLARAAGLSVGRGVRVDDRMHTSDPAIYAVGECAEHREIVYGLVAPGFEQAAVAAAVMSGEDALYRGSLAATRLKVLNLPVFSIGRIADDDLPLHAKTYVYQTADHYYRVAVEKRRLVGALAIGDAPQLGRLQEAVTHGRSVQPWNLWRFRRSGLLWLQHASNNVQSWPAHVTVCNCTGVTRGTLTQAIAAGARTACALATATGASSVCGSCRPLLAQLCGTRERAAPTKHCRRLLVVTIMAAVLAASFIAPLSLQYADSVQSRWSIDFLWRSNTFKQITGYATLALTVVGLLLSLRKRWPRIKFGDFAHWRIVHVALGALALFALLAHTGARLGSNLNLWLMICFAALAVCGVGSAYLIAQQHQYDRDISILRSRLTWAHILLFWPLPVLLGFHIFKSYYF